MADVGPADWALDQAKHQQKRVQRPLEDQDDPPGKGTRIVNALSREQHKGTGGAHYGRPGRIPGSINVPARELVDPETGCFRPIDELRARCAAAGALDTARTIVYCGGGIAATTTAK